MAGATLFIIATPLGNLGDLSPRAAEILRRVEVVAAEDTRRARVLLGHVGAAPRILSYHAHSPERRSRSLLEILSEGRDVALITDAGTPAISDPGESIVAMARAAGVNVVAIPGPSAVTAALSAAGLPAGRYLFLGFPPRRGKDRETWLRDAAAARWTVVMFEAPGRVGSLLADLASVAGAGRQIVLARELTKIHEEIRTGTLEELAERYRTDEVRGEVTLVMAAGDGATRDPEPQANPEERAAALLSEGLSRKDAAHQLAAELGLPRNVAYRLVMGVP